MIGVVLVTHGRLACEFRAALEHVVAPQAQFEVVTIGPDDNVEQRRNDIITAIKRVDSGDGVAILTDMFGGTPSNLAISCMSNPKVEVLAGINLPMLIKLAKVRMCAGLSDAVATAKEAGRKYVNDSRQVLTAKYPPRRFAHNTTSGPRGAGGLDAPTRREPPQGDAGPAGADPPGGDDPSDDLAPAEDALVRVMDVINQKGLHARASAKFVQTVEKFNAEVRVTRGGERVGGTSIMGLMMLGAAPGTSITVEAFGPQAAEVLDALEALLADRFGEEE